MLEQEAAGGEAGRPTISSLTVAGGSDGARESGDILEEHTLEGEQIPHDGPGRKMNDGDGDGDGGDGGGGGTSDSGSPWGTFRFQAKLPKLELPPLEDTLRRYLDAIEPLLPREKFEKTRAIVEEFRTSGEGDALQRSLLNYSSDKDSYVEEFWDDSYLIPKTSVVLNLNPFFVFETPSLSDNVVQSRDVDMTAGPRRAPDRSQEGGEPKRSSGVSTTSCEARAVTDTSGVADPQDTVSPAGMGANLAQRRQAWRAASLLYSSLRFASAVKNETLPPDMWKSTPLCMAQYRRLFGAHRKAVAHDADEMKVCKDSGHVVLLCRNQFYTFSMVKVGKQLDQDVLGRFLAMHRRRRTSIGHPLVGATPTTRAVGRPSRATFAR